MFGDRKPIAFAHTRFSKFNGTLSSNGRWIAYQSTESGQTQVYVQSPAEAGAKHQISTNGGLSPLWRSDGKDLFSIEPGSRLMAVPIDMTRDFKVGIPRPLFTASVDAANRGRQYAVARDGKRFLLNVLQGPSAATSLTAVVNWLTAVQK
jgi:hypothetical protein